MVALEVCLGATRAVIAVVEVVSRVSERWVPVVASCSGVVSLVPSLVLYR